MTPNPPIKGHHLKYEGKLYANPRYGACYQIKRYAIGGGCQCGALPPGVMREYVTNEESPPLLPSQNAVKRWHRQHKAELRSRQR